MKFYISFLITTVILGTGVAIAQEEEENQLNGGTITVVKPYDPTISDAFKVKSVPSVNDTTKVKKKPVTYSIFSVPVASTFTPATGKLDRLKPKRKEKFYRNYARLGLGNYVNILGEFATNFEIDRDSDVSVFFNHNSSQGGIDEVRLDDSFSDTGLDVSYGTRSRDMNWSIAAGGRYQTANWYGVYDNVPTQPEEDLDVATSYFSYGIGGRASFFDSVFKEADVQLTGVSSGNDASEFRARLRPQLGFDIMDTEVGLGVELDYLSGSFDQQVFIPVATDYGLFNAGLYPSVNLYGDNYKVELGARVNYATDIENSESDIYVYPDITASYILAEETVVAFTEIGGGFDVNSLQQFADENVFIAPALTIAPTDRQLDAIAGFKGKLGVFGYKVFGGYRIEKNRNFYITDDGSRFTIGDLQSYDYGNVFYTSYGDLNTVLYGASLGVTLNTALDVTLNVTGRSFDVSEGDAFENIASNLPELTADLTANYKIDEKWSTGLTLYYVGERDAYRIGVGKETIDGFVDLNLDVNYKINPKLTAFLRGNNLTGGNYQYFNGYPVQNLQVLGGIVYKFDF